LLEPLRGAGCRNETSSRIPKKADVKIDKPIFDPRRSQKDSNPKRFSCQREDSGQREKARKKDAAGNRGNQPPHVVEIVKRS